jgi:hypothetical protein
MGLDENAVVDPEVKVHALDRVRIADVSLMPAVPSAHSQAAIMAIAERNPDVILQRPFAPPSRRDGGPNRLSWPAQCAPIRRGEFTERRLVRDAPIDRDQTEPSEIQRVRRTSRTSVSYPPPKSELRASSRRSGSNPRWQRDSTAACLNAEGRLGGNLRRAQADCRCARRASRLIGSLPPPPLAPPLGIKLSRTFSELGDTA